MKRHINNESKDTNANNILAEVASWGKDKLLGLLLKNRYYLTNDDYNSKVETLAEKLINWCDSHNANVRNFR